MTAITATAEIRPFRVLAPPLVSWLAGAVTSPGPDTDQPAPQWFQDAVADAPDRASVEVDGVPIAYQTWGPRDRPGLVLVHGGAANASWWSHLAPLLVEGRRRVVAIDLSGHGDSGHRESYGLEQWITEVWAVTADAGVAGPPILIGHSMGGSVVAHATQQDRPLAAGVIVVDSVLRPVSPQEVAERARRAVGPVRRHPTQAAAMARFRPVPDQGRPLLPYVVDRVAAESVRQYDDGWGWKLDRHTFDRTQLTADSLGRSNAPVALVRAEHGRLSHEVIDRLRELLYPAAPLVEIPDSGHHIMLERPLALVTAIRALLATWEMSGPTVDQ